MTPEVVRLGDVGSTNDEAISRLRATGRPHWVIAARQLSGRGRRGRHWVSEPGNLYASLAFESHLPQRVAGILPLGAAVALGDALETLGARPEHKWPNDILLNGRKLSGILIEAEISTNARRVVAGFGVNIHHAPDDQAAALADHVPGASADAVFSYLAPAFAAVVDALDAPGGAAEIRSRWLTRAIGVGGGVTVRFDKEVLEGRFVGLDADGRLILDQGGATQAIAAGDVFVRTETL